MKKVNRYRQFVQQLLGRYGERQSPEGDIEVQTVFDTVHNHYQIMHVG